MNGVMTLVLWDVDHTLIDNGGVSKANYALAFEILTASAPKVAAVTGGRTDTAIMHELISDNGASPSDYTTNEQFAALAEAGHRNRQILATRGHALPGAHAALQHFAEDPAIVSSVLTGNIEANARTKLAAFGLERYIDYEVGGFGAESSVRADLVPVAQSKAAQRYDFDRAADVTVLIGDTHRDVQAGLDGGARVIAIATGSETVTELQAAGAHAVLHDLSDLHALLEALASVQQLGPGTRQEV